MHTNIWNTEKEKLAQKVVNFYREKIEKEQEMKNMITGNTRPVREDPQDHLREVNFMVDKRRNEIDKIL